MNQNEEKAIDTLFDMLVGSTFDEDSQIRIITHLGIMNQEMVKFLHKNKMKEAFYQYLKDSGYGKYIGAVDILFNNEEMNQQQETNARPDGWRDEVHGEFKGWDKVPRLDEEF